MPLGLLWFLGWSAVLAIALWFPARRLIFVFSVRRLQRKLGRELTSVETDGQARRAGFIAAFLVIVFAPLFNYNMFGIPVFR